MITIDLKICVTHLWADVPMCVVFLLASSPHQPWSWQAILAADFGYNLLITVEKNILKPIARWNPIMLLTHSAAQGAATAETPTTAAPAAEKPAARSAKVEVPEVQYTNKRLLAAAGVKCHGWFGCWSPWTPQQKMVGWN